MKSHLKGKIGEDAVSEIAERTYLKYWCYPNPKDELKDKKEICDLLIIFKQSILIISVKNYTFKGNYERYFRTTIDKAISQIHGAERKLFNSGYAVKFNHPVKGEFEFDSSKFKSIHRLIINLSTVPNFYTGGAHTSKGKYIHVFNWFAFLKVVTELNTIRDLIDYFTERENTFNSKQLIMLAGKDEDWTIDTQLEFLKYTKNLDQSKNPFILFSGTELDLLATYLFNGRKFNRNFYEEKYNGAFMEYDGKWDEYISKEEVKRKKGADRISYFIDEFIEREVLHYNDDHRIELATEMLSFSRFERRIIGKQFFDFLDKHRRSSNNTIARRYGEINGMIIAFFIHGEAINAQQAMHLMQIAVDGYSYWEKYKTQKIIMIGCDTKITQFKFAFVNKIEPFSDEYEKELIADLKLLNWFNNIKKINFHSKEYPDE